MVVFNDLQQLDIDNYLYPFYINHKLFVYDFILFSIQETENKRNIIYVVLRNYLLIKKHL